MNENVPGNFIATHCLFNFIMIERLQILFFYQFFSPYASVLLINLISFLLNHRNEKQWTANSIETANNFILIKTLNNKFDVNIIILIKTLNNKIDVNVMIKRLS